MSRVAESFLRFSDSKSIAIWDDASPWTYAQFYRQASRAASFFQANDIGSVAIGLPQGPEAYAVIWGAYLAGVVFCPLHQGLPKERLRQILLAFAPDASIGVSSPKEVSVEDVFSARLKESIPLGPVEPDVAYVMFTSGSTGTPKGVTVGRDSLEHVIEWSVKHFEVSSAARWAQYSGLGFDLSVLDIFAPLSVGASIVPFFTLGQKLRPAQRIKRSRVTHWHSVPSVFDLVARSNDVNAQTLESVTHMMFCGEPLYRAQVSQLLASKPDLRIFNNYGPTEATIFVSSQSVTANDVLLQSSKTIALGAAIDGNWFEFIGTEGPTSELVICGRNVALGYLRGEEGGFAQTADGIRTFRTGDFCVKDGDQVYFDGRRDGQIKVSGHRLDLSEIDFALRELGASACATVYVDEEIVAFVAGSATEHTDFQKGLSDYLPSYAMPKRIVFLRSLPYTPAGKIDRLSLRRLAAGDER